MPHQVIPYEGLDGGGGGSSKSVVNKILDN